MSKLTIFKSIKTGAAFSPAHPDPGSDRVYVKKENGICPVLSKDNKRDVVEGLGVVYTESGIFHPLDRVYIVNVPPKILYHYR